MYGEGKTAVHPEEAGSFAGELRKNLPLAKKRFLAALYCFLYLYLFAAGGGPWSLDRLRK
jgi:uncharacterized membrane protein YphA (DoxX/SURF4 family)